MATTTKLEDHTFEELKKLVEPEMYDVITTIVRVITNLVDNTDFYEADDRDQNILKFLMILYKKARRLGVIPSTNLGNVKEFLKFAAKKSQEEF